MATPIDEEEFPLPYPLPRDRYEELAPKLSSRKAWSDVLAQLRHAGSQQPDLKRILPASHDLYFWKGAYIKKETKNPHHSYILAVLETLIASCLPRGYRTLRETPVEVFHDSEPLADLAIVRNPSSKFIGNSPTGRDVALVVEVADESIAFDSSEKLEAYAVISIPVYWIVNLPELSIDVYTDPVGTTQTEPARYRELSRYREGETVPVVLDGLEVVRSAAQDVLP